MSLSYTSVCQSVPLRGKSGSSSWKLGASNRRMCVQQGVECRLDTGKTYQGSLHTLTGPEQASTRTASDPALPALLAVLCVSRPMCQAAQVGQPGKWPHKTSQAKGIRILVAERKHRI